MRGSCHFNLFCHSHCMNTFADIVTGVNNHNGSNTLEISCRTAFLVGCVTSRDGNDLGASRKVSCDVSYNKLRIFITTTTPSCYALVLTSGLLEAQLLKLKLASVLHSCSWSDAILYTSSILCIHCMKSVFKLFAAINYTIKTWSLIWSTTIVRLEKVINNIIMHDTGLLWKYSNYIFAVT